MNLRLQRMQKCSQSTMGEIDILGAHQCFTLEPLNPIPAGIYEITTWPPPEEADPWPTTLKHDYTVPLLNNVQGHTYIEIHIGNGPMDTKDCIIVGQSRSPDWVGNSTQAFLTLMLKYIVPAWMRKEKVTIEIRDIQ